VVSGVKTARGLPGLTRCLKRLAAYSHMQLCSIDYMGTIGPWSEEDELVAAAREGEGDAGVVRALLTDGCADIDACDEHTGHTAVHAACLDRHVDILRLLLEAGADWSIVSSEGRTPLDVVREKGFARCMEVLEVSRVAASFLDALHVWLTVASRWAWLLPYAPCVWLILGSHWPCTPAAASPDRPPRPPTCW
jgi:hypothetical protein